MTILSARGLKTAEVALDRQVKALQSTLVAVLVATTMLAVNATAQVQTQVTDGLLRSVAALVVYGQHCAPISAKLRHELTVITDMLTEQEKHRVTRWGIDLTLDQKSHGTEWCAQVKSEIDRSDEFMAQKLDRKETPRPVKPPAATDQPGRRDGIPD
jgi:hypothetical protein